MLVNDKREKTRTHAKVMQVKRRKKRVFFQFFNRERFRKKRFKERAAPERTEPD